MRGSSLVSWGGGVGAAEGSVSFAGASKVGEVTGAGAGAFFRAGFGLDMGAFFADRWSADFIEPFLAADFFLGAALVLDFFFVAGFFLRVAVFDVFAPLDFFFLAM